MNITDYPIELPESGIVEYTRTQKTGSRKWICHATQVNNHAKLPTANKSKFNDYHKYPISSNSDLICTKVRYSPKEDGGVYKLETGTKESIQGLVLVEADYATASWLDSSVTENWDGFLDVLEIGEGGVWESDGGVCDSAVTILFPKANYSITTTIGHSQQIINNIIVSIGSVNKSYWRGFAPETLLFESHSISTSKDYERNLKFDTITFKFVYNPAGWNTVWRAGEQARNSDGSLLFMDNKPIFFSAGRWDRRVPALYNTLNFSSLTGVR